jgi:hypothetical protein
VWLSILGVIANVTRELQGRRPRRKVRRVTTLALPMANKDDNPFRIFLGSNTSTNDRL